jgi:hypothetical protein
MPPAPEVAELLTAQGLQKFATADQSFFLAAAGRLIRDFCGWHIAPNITVTEWIECGEHGLIILPTLHCTNVISVQIGNRVLEQWKEYQWDASGVINRTVANWPPLTGVPSFPHPPMAKVNYSHGFVELPPNVAAIGYEVALQGMSRPGANAIDVGAGPYRVSLLKVGLALDADQKERLWNAGVCRAGIA